jgi:hypothetical protein
VIAWLRSGRSATLIRRTATRRIACLGVDVSVIAATECSLPESRDLVPERCESACRERHRVAADNPVQPLHVTRHRPTHPLVQALLYLLKRPPQAIASRVGRHVAASL